MKWLKENSFLAGLLAVTLIAAGGLSYFLCQSWTEYVAASDSYKAAINKLHSLQNKVPYPSEANYNALKVGLDDYREKVNAYRDKLSKMEFPLDAKVTPQMFQDNLRTAVNGIKEKATASNVKLPEKFYLGFERYQSEPPSPQAAPQLNREMRVIESLVNKLVEYKVESIGDPKRAPLPQEGSAAPSPAAAGNKNQPPEKGSPVLFRYPLEISFTAEQSKFRVAFNAMLGSSQFIIVRSVAILNTSPEGPSRSKAAEQTPAAAAANPFAQAGGATDAPPSMKVVFGRELVKSNLSLEIIDFVELPASKN